jgi:hypothetical protein
MIQAFLLRDLCGEINKIKTDLQKYFEKKISLQDLLGIMVLFCIFQQRSRSPAAAKCGKA